MTFNGAERTYYVALPKSFDKTRTYWPLVVVHGGGGQAQLNEKALAMRRLADETGLDAILILPEIVTSDKRLGRFPALGEREFLKQVLQRARSEFKLRDKILLTGYSMGGQFSHRFAFANPDLVLACAPLASGTWTTPDGKLLMEEYGEVADPKTFLARKDNAKLVPESLRDLFDARTAAVAGLRPVEGARNVPFLVMCGTLDPRHAIAVAFVEALRKAGYRVICSAPTSGMP